MIKKEEGMKLIGKRFVKPILSVIHHEGKIYSHVELMKQLSIVVVWIYESKLIIKSLKKEFICEFSLGV